MQDAQWIARKYRFAEPLARDVIVGCGQMAKPVARRRQGIDGQALRPQHMVERGLVAT